MITEDYVSFETSKLLNDNGFEGVCIRSFYDETAANNYYEECKKKHLPYDSDENKQFLYSQPTLQMAMKWLREKYNIHIEPRYFPTPNIYRYVIIHSPVTIENIDSHPQYFNTHEEACEAAIKYCLENLI